jgi:hypothetical protein
MARIKIIDPAQATGKSKELLTALQNNIKSVPNLAEALANSPAALKAWVKFRCCGVFTKHVVKQLVHRAGRSYGR